MDKIPEISVTQTFSFFELFKGTLYYYTKQKNFTYILIFSWLGYLYAGYVRFSGTGRKGV